MSARDNFSQAMNDMFGVGKASNNTSYERDMKDDYVSDYTRPQSYVPQQSVITYIAPGTVVEGTIRSDGDVEIAGNLEGNIEAEGKVTLHTDVRGNVTAKDLSIPSCVLEGDVNCNGRVVVGADADITGNISANEIICAGTIHGDLDVATHISLQSTATVFGKIVTNTMAMERGAMIRGGIEMREPAAEEPEVYEDESPEQEF